MYPRNMYRRKIRALCLVLLPIVLSGVVCIWITTTHVSNQLDNQGQHFGDAIADQLSLSLTDYLVNEDILSLNVVLTDLVARGNFDFASIYSVDNRLLAQAGRRSGGAAGEQMFSRDITWQNASMGYLQIGLANQLSSTPLNSIILLLLAIHLLIASITGLAVWFYADLIYLWIAQPDSRPQLASNNTEDQDLPAANSDSPQPPAPAPLPEPPVETPDAIILVIKLRPARLLPQHLQRIRKALSLYGGEMAPLDGDNVVVTFSQRDPFFQAICAGLLVLEIFRLIGAPIIVKLGMQVAARTAPDSGQTAAPNSVALANARKHASYLASIADSRLLTSQQFYAQVSDPGRFIISPYHSSLTPDGLVFQVEALDPTHQVLIQGQARQLIQNPKGNSH
jgi:uncharacterized membrane protein affecting hemolysin expression